MRAALESDASRVLAQVTLDDVVPAASITRARRIAVVGGLAAAGAFALWVQPGWQAFEVASAYAWPHTVRLDVTPGNVSIRPGQTVTIAARPSSAGGLVPRLVTRTGGKTRTIEMAKSANGYVSRFDGVTRSFGYTVLVGSASSPGYAVTVLEEPRVQRIDLRYEFPSYTHLPPRNEEDGGDIYAPAGTQVHVTVHASGPAAAGQLNLSTGPVALSPDGPGRLSADLSVSADGSYRVQLQSGAGVPSRGDPEYFIRVLDDRPPDVRIIRPTGDRQVTALEEVAIEASAEDDYGLASFDLVYGVRGGKEVAIPFTARKRGTLSEGHHTLYLEDLHVKPGDFVTYYARARDVGRGRRSAESRSDIFFLEVKPFNEEFAAAQSQAQAGMPGSGDLDDLVTAQKDIIVATWKLDKRSAAGRSSTDVKAVGRAQGELKQRTQRLAGPADRRGRPGVGASGPADNPIQDAVAAMGRAQAALDAGKTAEAVPGEMDALNQLLRAQAEVRRREVVRQQTPTGGGGFQRAREDLSTLFDRELQRQQQTNYETPRSGSDSSEHSDRNEALERVRQLAQRQDQLARQQEELAKSSENLSAEEMKRRLEKLTRDQTELRREAEQLAQQMAGQRREDQKQRSGDPSRLRDASEQMRGAASDLRREDPSGASANSSRALEQLRSLERQLAGGEPRPGGQRAIGDLQLEARDLADRERKLADRMGKGRGAGTPSAPRQAATEQEQLADRADRLGQQVQELAKGPQQRPSDQAAANATNRALRDLRAGSKMRDLARSLRESEQQPTPGAEERSATAARDLARALDKAADQLSNGLGTDQEGRRLSDQLSRARDVKERLESLRRQLAELNKSASNDPNGRGEGAAPGNASRDESQRLQQQYREQLQEASRLQQELRSPARTPQVVNGTGGAGSTPEGQLMVYSAPGTEAFKQDFSKWDVLHREVTLNLERLESTLSQQLLERALKDRLSSGPTDAAPDAYRRAVDQYFRSLAVPKP